MAIFAVIDVLKKHAPLIQKSITPTAFHICLAQVWIPECGFAALGIMQVK